MRRKNPLQLKVKAPSRGLVTRLPSDIADDFHPTTPTAAGDAQRVCAVAQNVRFEDGVICNAPGYEKVALSTALLAGMVSHWRLDELTGNRADAFATNALTPTSHIGMGVAGKIGNAAVVGYMGGFPTMLSGALAHPAAVTDYTVCGWVNFSSVSNTAEVLSLDTGFGNILAARRVGTHLTAVYNGEGPVTSGVTLSVNTWYFFAVAVDSGSSQVHLRVTTTVNDLNPSNPMIPLTAASVTFGIDSPGSVNGGTTKLDSVSLFARTLTPTELTTIYNSGNALDYPFIGGGSFNLLHQGNVIGATPTPFLLGTPTKLFLGTRTFSSNPNLYTLALSQVFTGTAPAADYRWAATDFIDKVVFAQNGVTPQYWLTGASTRDIPGLTVGSNTFDGVESFFGHLIFWSGYTVTWSDLNDFTNYIPVSATVNTLTATVTGSFTQPAYGASTGALTTNENPVTQGFVAGQFVRINDTQGGLPFYNYYLVTAVSTTQITMTLQHTTGATAPATTIGAGAVIIPLVANEAGSAAILGADANGPIFLVKAMGDYAYVFKERSIQSVQYVGPASGTFYIRTELTNEGMISRYAFVNLGTGRMIFLGQRELYDYSGGATPTPICQQYTRQLYAELDRDNLQKVVMMHRELRNEIWVVYPVIGGALKVLVWNYMEDTATLDNYSPTIQGLTAARMVDWVNDPSWLSLSDDGEWVDDPDTLTWNGLAGQGKQRVAAVATGDGNLVIHGNVYSRAGAAYTCTAETMDYDLGDEAIFKYPDVVNVNLQVRVPDTTPRYLTVQVGYRTTLDADLTWTAAKQIQVQGNANFTAKVNPGGGGRFIRLRFTSYQTDIQWRVSGFEIYARAGGTY